MSLPRDAGNVLISAGTWMEALMVVAHRRPDDGAKRLRELSAEIDLQVEPVDQVMSEVAYIGWQQFGKSNHPARLNYGDCFSYGLARAYDLRLLYKGKDFSQTDVVGVLDAVIGLADNAHYVRSKRRCPLPNPATAAPRPRVSAPFVPGSLYDRRTVQEAGR